MTKYLIGHDFECLLMPPTGFKVNFLNVMSGSPQTVKQRIIESYTVSFGEKKFTTALRAGSIATLETIKRAIDESMQSNSDFIKLSDFLDKCEEKENAQEA